MSIPPLSSWMIAAVFLNNWNAVWLYEEWQPTNMKQIRPNAQNKPQIKGTGQKLYPFFTEYTLE